MPMRDVFIIMPFNEQRVSTDGTVRIYSAAHMSDIYAVLQQAVREFRGEITVTRMEQPYGNLVEAIIKRLAAADVVIAVLTGRNANVFYELGIRHSLRQNTIMLVEHRDEYPFDLGSFFSYQYSIEHEVDRKALREFVVARLSAIEEQALPDSPVLDVLQASEFEQFRVLNMWETRRAAMILDGLVRELISATDLIIDCINRSLGATVDGTVTHPRQMRLVWAALEGFVSTRPLPGLPSGAYVDALGLFHEFKIMEDEWNRACTAHPQFDAMLQIVIHRDRLATGFLYDTMNALDFVIANQIAYGIPWLGSMDAAPAVIHDMEALKNARRLLFVRYHGLRSYFASFESSFTGVPSEFARLMPTPVGRELPTLAEFIGSNG